MSSDPNSTPSAPAQATDLVTSRGQEKLVVRAGKHALSALASAVTYDPVALLSPKVDDDFASCAASVRVLESLRYFIALVEYRLAADGWIRAWLASILRVLVLVMIPAAALGAFIWILVPVMLGIANIAQSIESACRSIFNAMLYLLLAVILGAVLISLFGVLVKRGESSDPKRKARYVNARVK